jgi:hypothetical protein
MSNDPHPPCERLTVIEIKPDSLSQSLRELGLQIVRESVNSSSMSPVDTIIVVWHSSREIGANEIRMDDFFRVQNHVQKSCAVRGVQSQTSVIIRVDGPLFQIVIDQWHPVTVSFYGKSRFDLRETRGMTNYSIIQVHEGPSEDNQDSDD